MKAQKDICKLKLMGGLRFKLFNNLNIALLAKLAWKIVSGKDSLWIILVKAKYLKNKSFFFVISYIWDVLECGREFEALKKL